jgi:hypothetical protein
MASSTGTAASCSYSSASCLSISAHCQVAWTVSQSAELGEMSTLPSMCDSSTSAFCTAASSEEGGDAGAAAAAAAGAGEEGPDPANRPRAPMWLASSSGDCAGAAASMPQAWLRVKCCCCPSCWGCCHGDEGAVAIPGGAGAGSPSNHRVLRTPEALLSRGESGLSAPRFIAAPRLCSLSVCACCGAEVL